MVINIKCNWPWTHTIPTRAEKTWIQSLQSLVVKRCHSNMFKQWALIEVVVKHNDSPTVANELHVNLFATCRISKKGPWKMASRELETSHLKTELKPTLGFCQNFLYNHRHVKGCETIGNVWQNGDKVYGSVANIGYVRNIIIFYRLQDQ